MGLVTLTFHRIFVISNADLLFVWKNLQVKKRTREISKVFHSYHPYDHKVNISFRENYTSYVVKC